MHHMITPAFPIPIYGSEFQIDDQRKQQIISETEMTRISSGDGFISVDKYILERPEYKDLRDIVETHIENFIHNVLKYNKKYKFYITNSWLIKHVMGDQANSHYHSNSLFSGVLYLQCDENSGQLIFDKNQYHQTVLPYCFEIAPDEHNLYNAGSHIFTPKPNLIVIFPSMLEHRVTPCNSDVPRYCIAFNTFLHGELGDVNKTEQISSLSL